MVHAIGGIFANDMSFQFITIDKPILSIEDYDPQALDEGEVTELPAGYGTVAGKDLTADKKRLKMITIMLTPTRIIKCPIDTELMEFAEDQKVKIVMGGTNTACILDAAESKYVYFNRALRQKYNLPRVMSGINMAVVVGFSGYIISLITKHQQTSMGTMIAEGGSVMLCLAALAYSLYFYTNEGYGHTKLRQYLKKLLK